MGSRKLTNRAISLRRGARQHDDKDMLSNWKALLVPVWRCGNVCARQQL